MASTPPTPPTPAWSLGEIELKTVQAFTGLTAAAELTIPAIPVFAERASTVLMRLADAHRLPLVGAPVFVYTGVGTTHDAPFRLQIALPVPDDAAFTDTDEHALVRYADFRCAAFDYRGPMTHIGEAYPEAMNRLRDAGHRPVEQSREVYKRWVAYDAPENITEIQLGVADPA